MPFFKKCVVHLVFVMLMVGAAWQGHEAALTDRNSLLYNIMAGEEVVEGPLDPSAYASTDSPGIGGARLAALEPNVGMEMITEYDPEASFTNTLGGNVIVAPLSPLAPEPGSSAGEQPVVRQKPKIYTVRDGDTVAGIAAEFNVSANTVLWANGLSKNDVIKVGDHLTILPTTGVLHTVADGDTISAIAKKYDVEEVEITKYNDLDDSNKLSIGLKLIVPDGFIAPQRIRIEEPVPADSQLADQVPAPLPVDGSEGKFIWPTVTNHISQYFRWGHTGVDIDNRSLPPVYAADAGTVEFSGRLGAYGNLVVINHGAGLQTYYAHNTANYVKKGEVITKGQVVAKVGSTGRSTGPHLHFEVRKNGRPINPLSVY